MKDKLVIRFLFFFREKSVGGFVEGKTGGRAKNRLRRSLLTIENNRLFCLENGWENQEMPFGEN